ncbi:MAG TPA: diacylglycerol kinase family protein [Firmicutes bacterium]|nr:diacylglycerol kinase family protein [Bacillota bacterium]
MKGFLMGFVYAGRGLWFCLRHERNFRIHLVAAAAVLGIAPFFHLSRGEWAALLLTLALVIGAEALNTAVEQAVDLASPGRHPKARAAKDAAAGAVLVCAAAAVGVGIALFSRPAGWAALAAFLLGRPWRLAALLLLAALALWFIFGGGARKEK